MRPGDQQQMQGAGPFAGPFGPNGPMDPNMLPEEPPQEHLMDYVVDLNPHRKTLEVFLMITMLMTCLGVTGYCILSYVIVEYFFAAGGLFAVVDKKIVLCVDEACGEYEHRTMGFVNWTAQPCENYFKFACQGFMKESVDVSYASYEPHHEIIAIEYDIILDLLFHDAPSDWPRDFISHHRKMVSVYTFCRTDENIHTDLVRELIGAKDQGLNAVRRKMDQKYPIFPFFSVIPANGFCYVYPAERFLPEQMYSNADKLREFGEAYMEHLQGTVLEDEPDAKNYIDLFFSIEKQLAEMAGHPKRRLYQPVQRTSLVADLDRVMGAEFSYCKIGKYIWTDKIYFKSLTDMLNKMSDDDIATYMIMWMLQAMSLAGKKDTPLARLHYRYVKLVNKAPSSEIRCIDLLEPMLRSYYLGNLRLAHTMQRRDLAPVSQENAKQALKNMVTVLQTFFIDSALSTTDIDAASKLLDKVEFKLFYPGSLKDPGFSVDHTANVAKSAGSQESGHRLEAWQSILNPYTSALFDLQKWWPIPTFSHEPRYFHSLNTMYVPYPVFAWAYMETESKLPFNIPVYGFKIIRELFKAIDYRAQWWAGKGTGTEDNYKRIVKCVEEKLEKTYKITKPLEQYETIAEIAAVHVLEKMYSDKVKITKRDAIDVRLPFLKTVSSQWQFFVALASELCARTSDAAKTLLNTEYGYKTAEQRLEILATHLPKYAEYFDCGYFSKMRYPLSYTECLFWRR